MEKLDQLYEGKAKKVYRTSDDSLYLVSYKDDATAFNGQKRKHSGQRDHQQQSDQFSDADVGKSGIPTHFVKELSDRETLVRRVSIIPLEVVVRNIVAGSLAKRVGAPEGTKLRRPVIEYCYKDDGLGDPMVNDTHILAMGWATEGELKQISEYALQINSVLSAYLEDVNIELIDFKLEFGKTPEGELILADEISPDTCRFWDSVSGEKLDKDRFRRDLGGVEDAYWEVMRRLMGEDRNGAKT